MGSSKRRRRQPANEPKPTTEHSETDVDGYPYIHRVEIVNFRNLSNFAVELERRAVLVGENSVGKSNLLHALRLVLDPALPDSYRVLRAEDFWDGLSCPFGGHKITVRVFLRGFAAGAATKAILADCIVQTDPLTALLTYEFRPQKKLVSSGDSTPSEDDYEFVVFRGKDENSRGGSEIRKWLSLFVLPALRDAQEEVQSARRSLLRPLLARMRPRLEAAKLAEVRAALDVAAATLLHEQPLRDLQDRINTRVREVVGPTHSVETKFDFAAGDADQLLRSLRLFLKETKLRSIADASLGTVNILFLSLLLQELDEQRSAKSLAGLLLAIEEPEAHLHPHLQRLLFRYALRRPHSVLVTTHSPHIASVAPLQSLTVLRIGDNGTRAHTVAPLRLQEGDIADIERYLDVTRAEMLFAKGIVLVEGSAEQFLVPAFATHQLEKLKLGSSLDEFGITVCSVSGTDFAPYWRVTSSEGWNIPRVVITDGDPISEEASKRSGLARGARLLGDQSVVEALKRENFQAVTAALDSAGIFVGERELELDLLSTLTDEIKASYDELRESEQASKRFSSEVDDALQGDPDSEAGVISRIEAIGKGRFAQRLAGKVKQSHEPPAYISAAIGRIVQLVQKK